MENIDRTNLMVEILKARSDELHSFLGLLRDFRGTLLEIKENEQFDNNIKQNLVLISRVINKLKEKN